MPTREPSSAMPGELDWHTLIRATVRECARTWELQARTGPVKREALEAIVSRAVVLLMQRLDGHAPNLVVALVPGLLHTMLSAFIEVLAEERDPD